MISLILARGGSKGVPRKNIKLLNGKPLIFYPINGGLLSKYITDVYVSTDDDEIAEISNSLGAKVIKRPKELSSDNSLDIDAFKQFCDVTGVDSPIVHLRATTPILDPLVIDNAIEIYNDNINFITSLRSAHESPESVYKYYIKNDNNTWGSIINNIDTDRPRQSYPKTYVPNGYVDIVNPKYFLKSNNFYGNKIYSFITDRSHEIDTIEDFEYIEFLMKKK